VITSDKYNELRVKRSAIKAVLSSALGSDRLQLCAPSDSSSVDGGVQVRLLEDSDGNPSDYGKLASAEDSARWQSVSISRHLGDMKDWPRPGCEENAAKELDNLMAFSKVSSAPWVDRNYKGMDNSPPSQASAVGSSRWDLDTATTHTPTVFDMDMVEPKRNTWDPNKFFNPILGKYVCKCDETFDTSKNFEEHLASGVHAAGVAR